MAPGAPPSPTECDSIDVKHVTNVFEGPEKKLVIQFAQSAHSANIGYGTVAYKKNGSAHCKSTCKPCPSRTLRSLRRDQIKAILNAARCTMLSAVSNMNTDAYLLSESSMFVSDFCITLKTCGTTTLLRALPVILRIVFEALGLEVLYVLFSRVAYLFPDAQPYPHDCFGHEVAYLDYQLAMKGRVFEAASHTGTQWYLYYARLQQSCERIPYAPINPRRLISPSECTCSATNDRTLELYMFDLDPVVMRRFMFHDRPYMIGSDDVRSGTTSYEIKSLLGDHDIIDGYNFEPCGYSMNALKHDSYYTIHVSPEREASYVSFETTARVHSFASLVAAVVKLFRPGRFTVSYVLLGCEKNRYEVTSKVPWSVVSRLISAEYSMIRDPNVMSTDGNGGCFASVASFQKLPELRMIANTNLRGLCKRDALKRLLLSVAVKHDAYLSGASVFEQSLDYGCENEDSYVPKCVVNLGRIARNWLTLRALGTQNTFRLRYAVRSNADKGVLTLLDGLDVDFEVVDAFEIDLLVSLGVRRSRIVLVTPVLTTALVTRFPLVGTVALFDVPAEAIHAALLRSNVDIEIRMVDDNEFQDLHMLLGQLDMSSMSVTSIALDDGPDSSYKKISDDSEVCEHVCKLCHIISTNFPSSRRDLALHLGEPWISKNASCPNVEASTLNRIISRLPMDGVVSIDASRALLADSISLCARIVGRRRRYIRADPTNKLPSPISYSYYLSDGAYGSLSCVLMSSFEQGSSMKTLRPHSHATFSVQKRKNASSRANKFSRSIRQKRKQDLRSSTLYGPTCDALDWIWKGDLSVQDVGDSILFQDLGAYCSTARTEFNGFGLKLDVSYVVAVADV